MTRRFALCHVLAIALLASLANACGDDAPERAKLVEPSFDAPCRYAKCSDHGECAPADDGGPMCLCNVGYGGASCTNCEPGFHVDALGRCAPDRSCAEQPADPCGLHGSCDDSDGVIMCGCDAGYEGPRCTLCEPGYGRSADGDCLQLVLGPDGGPAQSPTTSDPDDDDGDNGGPPNMTAAPALCVESSCDGHGTCNGSTGSILCSCSSGYTDDRCASCAGGYHRDADQACVADEVCTTPTCGDHGDCSVSGGVTSCTCDAGYAGEQCADCAPGYHANASACDPDTTCTATTCAAHGTCTLSATTPTCDCEDHYSGAHCEACETGYHRVAGGACAVNQVCSTNSCEPHGGCDASTGTTVCTCDTGYKGASCSECATGYHDGGDATCVANERCQVGSCAANSVCDESSGTVECRCATGYEGPACSACASGYHRDAGSDACVPFGCEDNPIGGAATVNFDKVKGMPDKANTCYSNVDIDTDDVELTSIDGEGTALACAASEIYGLASKHVVLTADSRGSAMLTFSGLIASLSFDYGAKTVLSLAVLGDGKMIQTLNAAQSGHASLSLTFDPPIRVLALRSMGGVTNRIGIDNIAYAPPPCD